MQIYHGANANHFTQTSKTKIRVLFVPFDATKAHMRRNATKGIESVYTSTTLCSQQLSNIGFINQQMTSPGMSMSNQQISSSLTDILESIINYTQNYSDLLNLTSEQRSILSLQSAQTQFNFKQRRLRSIYPQIIFLSEQPTDVDFPERFTLDNCLTYKKLGSTGFKRVQIITAYALEGSTSSSQPLIGRVYSKVISSKAGKNQHILFIEVNDYIAMKSRVIAGVHLSAKNTGLSSTKCSEEMATLLTNTQEVDVLLGDFNMDVLSLGGHRGSDCQSELFIADHDAIHKMHSTPFSNSTNTKFYMGIYLRNSSDFYLDCTASHSLGTAASRELNGQYFSDHPPIYIELSSKSFSNKMLSLQSSTWT